MFRFNTRLATRQDLEDEPVVSVHVPGISSVGGKKIAVRDVLGSHLLKDQKDTISFLLNEAWDDIFGNFRTVIIKNSMETAVLLRIDFREFGDKPDIVVNHFDILTAQVEKLEDGGNVDNQMCMFYLWFFFFLRSSIGCSNLF